MSEQILMDAAAVGCALEKLAGEILERNPVGEPLGLIGMHTLGIPLARRLHGLISGMAPGRVLPGVGELDISFHRDDLRAGVPFPKGTRVPFDIEGRRVVLVDDVLYTGRSVRAALNALLDMGRTHNIQLAVLVDRGHRELPVRADYTGCVVETPAGGRVVCRLVETDGVDEVRWEAGA